MNRLSGRSVGSIFALALGTWVLFMGLNSVAEAASTLTLEQPVHFMTSDGTDVKVEAGTYEVNTLVGSLLRLNMEGGETVFLEAQATTHSEEIEAPLAVTVRGEDPDVVHIVLLLPNSQALDAPGSISGTRSRGFSSLERTARSARPRRRERWGPCLALVGFCAEPGKWGSAETLGPSGALPWALVGPCSNPGH